MARAQTGASRNRLAAETSPYLLQHADNPVDWYPWGDEALERARREDKPILLSIGYSACHWCHVMAHESFEDPATARLMNERYINIKVDREERPDLDRIYQTAHQFLTQRPGGWPLTVFLTPDQVPFVAGTYFPPRARHGLPALRDILERVATFYHDYRAQVEEQNSGLLQAMSRYLQASQADTGRLDNSPLRAARRALAEAYDAKHGGFGGAPKFPHVADLQFLLRRNRHHDDPEAARMALHGVRAMIEGGLFDQLGGGFFRYSVDERWEIPHFEKMLYDNGPLLEACVDAWQVSGDPLFRQAAVRTAAWVMAEMQAADGGYYATLDADSGGMEGGYYLWLRKAVAEQLTPEEHAVAALAWGLDRAANFEGHWHLTGRLRPEAIASRLGLSPAAAAARLESARDKLLGTREQRPRPGRDEKVLTAWNGLMIRAMADAGRRLNEPRLVGSAEKALEFVRSNLFRNGRLLAVWKDDHARLPAYLDDYAFLIDGILALLQARWRDDDLAFAIHLADALLEHFEDEAHGGFFFTADDHEALIQRPKPFADESTPSGNGVAARALLRLGHLTGRLEYGDAAERTIRAGWKPLTSYPAGHGALLQALEEYLTPSDLVVIRGTEDDLPHWRAPLGEDYAPDRLLFAVPDSARNLPGLLGERKPLPGGVAYLCRGTRCSPPLHEPQVLADTLAYRP